MHRSVRFINLLLFILNVAYSDLKPDNILLDALGHVHITDFNVAIHYSERRLHTSVAGSMAYMAPEVIGRQGYTWCADWWSLGVVAWELLFHRRPFDGRSADKMKHSILKDTIRLPSNAKDKCSKEGQRFVLAVRLPPVIIRKSHIDRIIVAVRPQPEDSPWLQRQGSWHR